MPGIHRMSQTLTTIILSYSYPMRSLLLRKVNGPAVITLMINDQNLDGSWNAARKHEDEKILPSLLLHWGRGVRGVPPRLS